MFYFVKCMVLTQLFSLGEVNLPSFWIPAFVGITAGCVRRALSLTLNSYVLTLRETTGETHCCEWQKVLRITLG